MNSRNQKVTVMGLGHFGGGLGAARWLAKQGAKVTVTDLADEKVLAESLAKLNDVPIANFHLGGHLEEDFRDTDLIVVNPAVKPASPFLQIARAAGVPIRCELELFMNACPARIIGVTGSNGKSTTAAMIAAILRRTNFQSVPKNEPVTGQIKNLSCDIWLGGNLGGSLLENLAEMRPDDWVVLEISSFQLHYFSPQAKMPHIAVVTGCTPNHLDWHGTFAEYAAAKQKLLLGQSKADIAVLNADAEVVGWSRFVRGRLAPPYPPEKLSQIELSIPGEHNRTNASLAAAAAREASCTDDEIAAGLKNVRGLPQRCEWSAVIDGRQYYNDSAATTPESTIAALKTFTAPVWLIAGGRNKGFDFSILAATIVQYARGAAFFGTCRGELEEAVAACHSDFTHSLHENLSQALAWCREKSQPGQSILLSPACASTDQFRNFRERGEAFVKMVKAMAGKRTAD